MRRAFRYFRALAALCNAVLTIGTYGSLVAAAGVPTLDTADVERLFEGIDTNGNGEINMMELRRGGAWLQQYGYTSDTLKDLPAK